jgi:hypothetical protein
MEKNKIIVEESDDQDLVVINKIKTSEILNNDDNKSSENLIKQNITINSLIKSTDLRLPSEFIDLSYDTPQNK